MTLKSPLRRQQDCLRIAVLVNPVAGLGGAVALKGSDGRDIQAQALARGGTPRGQARAVRFIQACIERSLPDDAAQLQWLTWGGAMGADAFAAVQAPAEQPQVSVLGSSAEPTSAQDTQEAALTLLQAGADLLVFVGGDGTARDLIDALFEHAWSEDALVLGVPAGVKMHSSVFATNPEAAAAVACDLASGAIVSVRQGEVRDLDEAQRRAGQLRTQHYGELLIPEAGGYLQHTKEAGRENESLALEELVAHLQDHLFSDLSALAQAPIVIGPGSSCARIKTALGLEPTLLGVDVWSDGAQLGTDVDAAWLQQHAPQPKALIISFIRGQGFLFGRGNQQLSAPWLAALNPATLTIIGTRSKLASLAGRPLLVDTDDVQLNESLCGLHRVLVGYEDELWYRVAQYG